MRTLYLIIFITFPKLSFSQTLLDQIIAKVDNYYILSSELSNLKKQYETQPNAPTQCQLLESMVINKMLLAKAEIDSVTVEDKQVNAQLNQRMEYFIQQFGSEKNISEAYDKPLDKIKTELRQQLKEQMIVQKVQKTITEAIRITPEEIKIYFNEIPKDSIPVIPVEVEIGHIVRYAKATKDQKTKLRNQLLDLKKRVLSGESFEKLAKEYSEDLGSGKNGGNLGFAKRGTMVPEFEATSMTLKKGEISDIIETEFGLHLIQLVDRRGQEYFARHILLRPDTEHLDLEQPTRFLDSLRTLIQNDSLTFEKAAKQFSQDRSTSDGGGWIIDPNSGNRKLIYDGSMDPSLFFVLDTMKVGAISKPLNYRTEEGRNAVRLLYYKTKHKLHIANLTDDFARISQIVLGRKRASAVEKWFSKASKDVFIRLEPEYKECGVLGQTSP